MNYKIAIIGFVAVVVGSILTPFFENYFSAEPPPTPTPTVTFTPTSTPTATFTPTFTPIPPTLTPTATITPTATPIRSTDNWLNMPLEGEPDTLDPYATSGNQFSAEILRLVCQPLAYRAMNANDGNLPLLASWDVSNDERVFTFTIKPNVRFHDGTLLDAAAVKYSFERIKADSVMSSTLISGTIEAVSTNTVVFKFPESRYDFIANLDNEYLVVVSPKAAQNSNFGEKPICTGPYEVEEWKKGEYIQLKANPVFNSAPAFYKNQGPAKINRIRFKFMPPKQLFPALLEGKIDILSLTADEFQQIKANDQDFDFLPYSAGGISYLGFNNNISPTNVLTLRQAVIQAIDKQAIIEAVLPNIAVPVVAPLDFHVVDAEVDLADFAYKFNPKQSRDLLTKMGFTDSDNDNLLDINGKPFTLRLLTTPDKDNVDIANLIGTYLSQVGITITIRTATAGTDIAQVAATGEFDLLFYHYNWPYDNALSLFLSSNGCCNRVGYSNPQVDQLLQQADQTRSYTLAKRKILIEAQKIILQDAPWQPFLARESVKAVNKRVQGVKKHPVDGVLLHDAELVIQ